jgi:hypothetical protein
MCNSLLDTRPALPRSPLRPSLVEPSSKPGRSLVAAAAGDWRSGTVSALKCRFARHPTRHVHESRCRRGGMTTVVKPRRAVVIGRRQRWGTQISYFLHPSTAAHSATVLSDIRYATLCIFALFASREPRTAIMRPLSPCQMKPAFTGHSEDGGCHSPLRPSVDQVARRIQGELSAVSSQRSARRGRWDGLRAAGRYGRGNGFLHRSSPQRLCELPLGLCSCAAYIPRPGCHSSPSAGRRRRHAVAAEGQEQEPDGSAGRAHWTFPAGGIRLF